jgi:ribonucleoside-diphosphate reductase alpha chain
MEASAYLNSWPLPQIKESSMGNRKIGLGIMGLADTLILLGMRYDSDAAVAFAGRLGEFLREHAHCASRELAECFPNWEGSLWQTEHNRPMRNATCTTIAPTGSISIIARCSSGIEPIFKYACKRRALDGSEFIQLHPLMDRLGREQGWLTDRVRTELMAGVEPKDMRQVPQPLKDVLVTAHEIAPEWHVAMQAAMQVNTDNAVSKRAIVKCCGWKEFEVCLTEGVCRFILAVCYARDRQAVQGCAMATDRGGAPSRCRR